MQLRTELDSAREIAETLINETSVETKSGVAFVYDDSDNLILKIRSRHGNVTEVPDIIYKEIDNQNYLNDISLTWRKLFWITPMQSMSSVRDSHLGMVGELFPKLSLKTASLLEAILSESLDDTELATIIANHVSFGNGVVGLYQASIDYFSVSPDELTELQLEFLSSLIGYHGAITSDTINSFVSKVSDRYTSDVIQTELYQALTGYNNILETFIRYEIEDKLVVSDKEFDEMLDTNLFIKTSLSFGAISFISEKCSNLSKYPLSLAIVDNSTGMIKAVWSSDPAGQINPTTVLDYPNATQRLAVPLCLYAESDRTPISFISSDNLKPIKDLTVDEIFSVFPYLEDASVDMEKKLGEFFMDATTPIKVAASYGAVLRDGVMVAPSCVVEIKSDTKSLYRVDDSKSTKLFNLREARVTLTQLSPDGKSISIHDEVDESSWDIIVNPSNTIVLWSRLPVSERESLVSDILTLFPIDNNSRFPLYKGLAVDEVQNKKDNLKLLMTAIQDDLTYLQTVTVTSDNADEFETIYNNLNSLLSTVSDYVDQVALISLKEQIYSYRRSNLSQLLIYARSK